MRNLLLAALFLALPVLAADPQPQLPADVPAEGDHMNWVYSSDSFKVGVDISKIQGTLPVKNALVVFLNLGDDAVFAQVSRFEFDCEHNTVKQLSYTTLDGDLKVLSDKKLTDSKPLPVPPTGSMASKVITIVCERESEKQTVRPIPGKQIETQSTTNRL